MTCTCRRCDSRPFADFKAQRLAYGWHVYLSPLHYVLAFRQCYPNELVLV